MRRLLLAGVLVLLASTLALSAVTGVFPLVSGVTTNTTTTVTNTQDLNARGAGQYHSYVGRVAGTGAVTQTQAIYGDIDADATNGMILLCTLTLSGTTQAQDACAPVIENYPVHHFVTTNTTGTGASGSVVVVY